jgi:hypothetical protein
VPIGDVDGSGVCLSSGALAGPSRDMQLFVQLTLLALVAAGIMGTGLGFLVKFIVEANQTPRDRIASLTDDASRK